MHKIDHSIASASVFNAPDNQKVLGRSPIEHLIRLRIDRAIQLLRDSGMNITDPPADFMRGAKGWTYSGCRVRLGSHVYEEAEVGR